MTGGEREPVSNVGRWDTSLRGASHLFPALVLETRVVHQSLLVRLLKRNPLQLNHEVGQELSVSSVVGEGTFVVSAPREGTVRQALKVLLQGRTRGQ